MRCNQKGTYMYTEAKNKLLEFGISPSMQRLAIMDYMMNNHTHPTVDVIYHDLIGSIPTLSKTTVYNTLKLFADHGAIQMLTICEKNVRWDERITPHAHFLCKECGKLLDVRYEAIFHKPEVIDGNVVSEVHIYYKGVCKDCKEKSGS